MSQRRLDQLSFSQVVGQDTAKRALLLAAVEPMLAGVLLRGDKGSAKTTLARGLATLLPGNAPFVELPLGASEDRVIGSIDVSKLLTDGQPAVRHGLLAAAHGGVLYVDEINLLADHLVDALLDAAATGTNRIERDGISHRHPARFVLVASMNPEEGELRPQLLDRFGLAVDVTTSQDPDQRALAVRRQLAAERTRAPSATDSDDERLQHQIAGAMERTPALPDSIVLTASRLAIEVGAEGLRADLMLCRAATAAAALDADDTVTEGHLRSVAEMVLAHRRRRQPFDQPGIDHAELDEAWQHARTTPDAADRPDEQQHDEPSAPRNIRLPTTTAPTRGQPVSRGGFDPANAVRGRAIRTNTYDHDLGLDAHATAIAASVRAGPDQQRAIRVEDLRSTERRQRSSSLVVFVLDTSASMGVEHRMAATKAAVLGMLSDAYRRRGRVALVTFHHDHAEVVLRPTASVEIAGARLTDLATGGTTPLAAGLDMARQLIDTHRDTTTHTHVIVLTDGRATHADGDPAAAARAAAHELARAATSVVIVDTEPPGPSRLGLAKDLASTCGTGYVHIDALDGHSLEATARRLERA
jgi:magnesium chelatase subunit D